MTGLRSLLPDLLVHSAPLPVDRIGADFAARFAGVPATSSACAEPAVLYPVTGSDIPVLLGMYGCEERVRGWLPGGAADLVERAVAPEHVVDPPCQQAKSQLSALPVLRTTPRDAGPYITMGVVHAHDPETGESALSVHRMLVLSADRLAIWMVPGRQLLAMHRRLGRLPVSVNIGAPPAAMVASALSSAVLPDGVGKLDVAGALAGAPLTVADGISQPVRVLASAEIVLEGYLSDEVADEGAGVSLPEFLGYDGDTRSGLPVLTVTAVTTRRDPVYQAVIGPGREQSVILGLAGALSVALCGDPALADLHFPAAGGGMLTLFASVRPNSDLASAARRIFDRHRFVKLIVFTDTDVDIRCAEDVWWAVTTRANLGADCTTFDGYQPLAMDPSQAPGWRPGGTGRTFIDATSAHPVRRSFA
ncbi:UbiD family decarboxylase [Lentzea tibetensis]|uniref:UbiD family decarboxylase n=1 Tax=Lentzea tibetensis TaxID=2591470 RepID=A0A563EMJ6_9PSEU|nr:UbiD family decarboxylase [Lentzea tibetensis]TWP48435.1 UbiD family decarboxylase [Lentzea tibetensis]